MTEGSVRRRRLDELWDAKINEGFIASDDERLQNAVRSIQMLRNVHERAIASGEDDNALSALASARQLLSLVTAELADWMIDLPGSTRSSDPNGWAGRPRYALRSQIALSDAISPLHREAVDPVALVLPRWLFSMLSASMDALEHGEVHTLLEPATNGRHDQSWTWDQMRRRAVDHVYFLCGQNWPVTKARSKISAIIKASSTTLRGWELDLKKSGYSSDIAMKAGELKLILEENPRYAEDDGNSIDGYAFDLLKRFQAEPLAQFGESYVSRFGHRHNQ